jgi:aspartyl-tRNA(Asn)/glutamyl-tRNA(Gln) amidotransferase subunit A
MDLPASGIRARIRDGTISSTEATSAYLDRIDRLDSRIGAYLTVRREEALDEAKAADCAPARASPGLLHGLPIALKDNIDTAGVRTTVGSAFFADNVPERDAEIVRRLRAAGAVVLGKTSLHEFAYGVTGLNPHFGPCRNPWDPERVPGGSSGGSAAAVAAGLCAAAVGTDTGGSVRIPAALTGVGGLRPTFGRIPMDGVFPSGWSFDTVGPLARGAEDLAAVWLALRGSVDIGQPEHGGPDGGLPGLRVGVVDGFFLADVDADVGILLTSAAEALADVGAVVERLELAGADRALEAMLRMHGAESYAIHRKRFVENPDLYGDDLRERLTSASAVSGADYAEARDWARQWRMELAGAFERFDLLLSPATCTPAPEAESMRNAAARLRLTRFMYVWSVGGVPALVVPCGFAGGLPVGLQIVAPRDRELSLLRAAAAYQAVTDWHLREPAGFAVERS